MQPYPQFPPHIETKRNKTFLFKPRTFNVYFQYSALMTRFVSFVEENDGCIPCGPSFRLCRSRECFSLELSGYGDRVFFLALSGPVCMICPVCVHLSWRCRGSSPRHPATPGIVVSSFLSVYLNVCVLCGFF